MPSTRRSNANVAFRQLLTKHGRIGGSAAKRGSPKPRIRTGAFGLDLALGGGFPVGSAVEFWGDPRSGKTTSCHRVAAAFQRVCRRCLRVARDVQAVAPEDENDRWEAVGFCDCVAKGISPMPDPPPRDKNSESAKEYKERCESWSEDFLENSYEEVVVLWIDTEDAYDSAWASRLGVDPRRILLITPSTSENVSDAVKAFIWSGGVDLTVLDSIAQLTPRKEIEESAEQAHQGLGARVLNRMIRTWISGAIDVRNANNAAGIPHGLSQLWVNQVRQKIGVSYGDPSVQPYGLGQKFATKVELKFKTPEAMTKDVKFSGSTAVAYKETVSEKIRMRVDKNNTSPGLRKLETEYTQVCTDADGRLPGDLDDSKYIYNLATHHGAIIKLGKTGPYEIVGREEDPVKTQKEVKELIESDFVVRRAVEDHILSRMARRGM